MLQDAIRNALNNPIKFSIPERPKKEEIKKEFVERKKESLVHVEVPKEYITTTRQEKMMVDKKEYIVTYTNTIEKGLQDTQEWVKESILQSNTKDEVSRKINKLPKGKQSSSRVRSATRKS